MIYPDKKDFLKKASECDIVPVCKEILADMETPVSVLQRFAGKKNTFLLESMEGGEKWGRYSFVGVDPDVLLETDHSDGKNGELEKLRKVYSHLKVADIPGLPRFFGGAVGFIGYEAMCEFEDMPKPKPSSCTSLKSVFLKADNIVIFDNLRHTISVVVCATTSRKADSEQYDSIIRKLNAIVDEIRTPLKTSPASTLPPASLKSNMDKAQFMAMVEKAKKYIFEGDIIQVVLSQKFSVQTSVPPVQLYRALRFLNPSPYTFFLKAGDTILVGSSPEVMVRLTGNRVELRPIAGTRPRGTTEQEDRALANEMLGDEKEKAEHVMLVDLGRNDLGKISEVGSVQVTEYMVVERYSHVMHLVSHAEGTLKKGYDAYDVIKAAFPAGTLSGAPKIRAMQIIHELEPSPRGAYGGAVGYISYSGNMDLAITIRTVVIEKDMLSVQTGAGIVFDSQPEKEYEETLHKAAAMRKALEMALQELEVSKTR